MHTEENGIIATSFTRKQSAPPDHDCHVETEDETDMKTTFKKKMKNLPSVRVHRLFRKNSSSKRKSTLEFNADDFDVPASRGSKVM